MPRSSSGLREAKGMSTLPFPGSKDIIEEGGETEIGKGKVANGLVFFPAHVIRQIEIGQVRQRVADRAHFPVQYPNHLHTHTHTHIHTHTHTRASQNWLWFVICQIKPAAFRCTQSVWAMQTQGKRKEAFPDGAFEGWNMMLSGL